MAIPSFVALGTTVAGVGDVSPGIPAGSQADDIMLLFVESNSSQPAAAPTDWTQFPDSPQDEGGAGSTCLSVFWKRHDGSESAPTVTDTGNHTHAVIMSVRGCITAGNPYDVTAGNVANTSTTAVSVPGDTTTVADCLIVGACTHGTDAAAGTAEFDNTWANTDLANLTERFDNCTDQGGGGGMGIFTGEKATAGSFGATTATLDTASEQGRFVVALKPPAGGGTDATVTMPAAGILTLTATNPAFRTTDSVTLPAAGIVVMTASAPSFSVGDSVVLPAAGLLVLGAVAPTLTGAEAEEGDDVIVFNPFLMLYMMLDRRL